MTSIVLLYNKDKNRITVGADNQSSSIEGKKDITIAAKYRAKKITRIGKGVLFGSGDAILNLAAKSILTGEHLKGSSFITTDIDLLSEEALRKMIESNLEFVSKVLRVLKNNNHYGFDDVESWDSSLLFFTEKWQIWINTEKALTFKIWIWDNAESLEEVKRKFKYKANVFTCTVGSGSDFARNYLNKTYHELVLKAHISDKERIRRTLQSASSRDSGTNNAFRFEEFDFNKAAFKENCYTKEELSRDISGMAIKDKSSNISLKRILKAIGENQYRAFSWFTIVLKSINGLWVNSAHSMASLIDSVVIGSELNNYRQQVNTT